ncbi:MAG TPA: carboxypeptidase-like regulatory domain-containing protein [Polyangia bacterium]|nr:carboxypeptidase-like regulatory domain-containing protein [Polyangia bacterium]
MAPAYLRGRVVDRRGQAVPDARVLAFAGSSAGQGGRPPATVATDFEGGFKIGPLAAGSYRLLIEAAGFPTAERTGVAAPAAELELRLDGEGRSIAGRVELAGVPVVGATVALADEAGGPARQARTRADGGFVFGGLGAGDYALRAEHDNLVSPIARGISVGRPGTRAPLRLSLQPGLSIVGRVVEDDGQAPAGAEVRGEVAALTPGEDPLPARAHTDAGGGFRLGPFLPGSYRLTTARPGYVLRRSPTVDLADAGSAPPSVILELLRGARVIGRVVDAHGAPVAAAHVRCMASAMDDLTVQLGPLPLAAEAAALPSGAGRALGSTRVALSDKAGRFVVEDLIPGRYRVEVAHTGSEPMRTDEFVLAPGERRDLGALALRDGIPVEGQVLDEAGGPLEGARVLVGSGAAADPAGFYALTDAGGHFSVAVPAGSYRLTASAPGHGSARVSVEVPATGAPAAVEIRLVRAEAVLEGLVRDADGRPLSRARLLVWPRDPPAGGTAESSPIGSGSADIGGHFRLVDLPAGELRLEVQHPDYPITRFPATPGRYAALTVPLPGGIAGEAHVRSTGAAVARGRVEAVGPDGAKASADLQRAGAFRLPRLVPGRWRVSVSAPGFRPAEQELDVPPSANPGEMSVRELRVDLDPT